MSYGADATGEYAASNYITEKAPVRDDSLAMGIGLAGQTTAQAWDLYETRKAEQFGGEVRAATEDEFGQSTVKTLVDLTESEQIQAKDFEDSVKRLAQAGKLGGPGTAMRVALRIDNLIKTKTAENPLLAQTYREIGAKVVNSYDAQIKLFTMVEEMAAKAGSEDPNKQLRTQVYSLTAELGNPSANSVDQMDAEELREVHRILTNEKNAMHNAKKSREVEKERRAAASEYRQERQLAATLENTAVTRSSQMMQQQILEAQLQDSKNANDITKVHNDQFGLAIRAAAEDYAALQPGDQEGLRRVQDNMTRIIAEMEAKQEQLINAHYWHDSTKAQILVDAVSRKKEFLTSFLTKDLSQAKRGLAELQATQTFWGNEYNLSHPEIGRLYAVDPTLVSSLMQQARTEGPQGAAITRMVVDNVQEYAMSPAVTAARATRTAGNVFAGFTDPQTLSPAERQYVKAAGFTVVGQAAQPGSDMAASVQQNPQIWGNAVNAIFEGGITQNEVDDLTSKVYNSQFINFFNAYKSQMPANAEVIAKRNLFSAEAIGKYISKQYEMWPSDGNPTFDPMLNRFYRKGGTPNRQADEILQRVNNHLTALDAISEYDQEYQQVGKPQGITPKAWYAQKLYNHKTFNEETK